MGRWTFCIFVALVTPAWADPPAPQATIVRLDVQGSCPRTDDLRRAFDGRVPVGDEGASWTVAVHRVDGSSRLDLRRADGSDALDREIASEDCAALADAFAVIVEAHFVELHLLPAKKIIVAAAPPPDVEVARPAPPPEPVGLSLALAGGVAVDADPADAAAAAEIDSTLALPRLRGAVLRLAWHATSVTTQTSRTDHIERWTTGVRAGLAWRWQRRSFFLQPGAALALLFAHVAATDLAGQPSVVRLHPGADFSLVAGVPIGGRFSLRAEIATTVFPSADRYLIDPIGEVGSSPRVTTMVGLGLQADWNL
jgi:hypothetical protein